MRVQSTSSETTTPASDDEPSSLLSVSGSAASLWIDERDGNAARSELARRRATTFLALRDGRFCISNESSVVRTGRATDDGLTRQGLADAAEARESNEKPDFSDDGVAVTSSVSSPWGMIERGSGTPEGIALSYESTDEMDESDVLDERDERPESADEERIESTGEKTAPPVVTELNEIGFDDAVEMAGETAAATGAMPTANLLATTLEEEERADEAGG